MYVHTGDTSTAKYCELLQRSASYTKVILRVVGMVPIKEKYVGMLKLSV